MYLYESRVGKKSQTVVPLQIRETAGIEEGDYLVWELNEKGQIIVSPQKSKTEHLASLTKKVWGNADKALEHIREERKSWE